MKRLALSAVLLLAVAASAPAAEIRGAWTADAADLESGKIHMQLTRKHSNNGQTMDASSLAGLSQREIESAVQVPVSFALRREAGTVHFEGTFKAGFGAGQFSFTANPAYLDTLRSLGVSTEPKKEKHRERPIEERLLHLALQDVSTAFIRSMQAEGYRGSLEEYVSFRIFRVTPDFVRELRSLGYDGVPARSLVSMRIHKVTPEFIRNLRGLGYDGIPVKKLVSMRIHKVTPEFIRELRSAGYANVPVDKLISMRIHGVDAEFARKMNTM